MNKNDLSRAVRGLGDDLDFPAVVLIDNCSYCNLRCSACDHVNISKYRKQEFMDLRLYKKVIDEIALENPNARVWEIFFGDPFICKDMPERIKYAKSKGLTDVVLNTNGVLMTPDKSAEYIKAGLDAIYVGIDAFKPESCSKIRVGGNLDTVISNVRAYRDLIKECGRQSQKIFAQYVVNEINENETQDFISFWTKEKVDVKIRQKISWAGLIEASNLTSNESVERRPCYWLMRTMNICSNGDVALCSADLHCRVKCGNIKEKSMKDIWGEMLKKYRQMHKESRYAELPVQCRDCRDWQSAYADFVSPEDTPSKK